MKTRTKRRMKKMKSRRGQKKAKRPNVKFIRTFYLYSLWPIDTYRCPTCNGEVSDDEFFYCVLDKFDINCAVETFLRRKPFEMFCEWCIENNVTDRFGRSILLKEIMYRVWEARSNYPFEILEGVKIVRVLIPREISVDIEQMWDDLDG
jgi:hypothetical protein